MQEMKSTLRQHSGMGALTSSHNALYEIAATLITLGNAYGSLGEYEKKKQLLEL
jgi:hypothetical protein